MFMIIYAAITEFQVYLIDNIGKPVDIQTIGAFNQMVKSILKALV